MTDEPTYVPLAKRAVGPNNSPVTCLAYVPDTSLAFRRFCSGDLYCHDEDSATSPVYGLHARLRSGLGLYTVLGPTTPLDPQC